LVLNKNLRCILQCFIQSWLPSADAFMYIGSIGGLYMLHQCDDSSGWEGGGFGDDSCVLVCAENELSYIVCSIRKYFEFQLLDHQGKGRAHVRVAMPADFEQLSNDG
jgi:hypothetical protein